MPVEAPASFFPHRHDTSPQIVFFLLPACLVSGLFLFWPLAQVGWLAMQRWDGYGPRTFTGSQNLMALWDDDVFRTALNHSLAWDIGAALLPTAMGFGIALLALCSRRGTAFLAILFFPALLPATVIAALSVLILSPISGLLNTTLRTIGLELFASDWLGNPRLALPALFLAWTWSALGIGALIFYAGMRAIGQEYIELALIEGAGWTWRLRRVILPGVRRLGVIVFLINVALGAQVFDLVFVTTGGGPGYATLLLPIDMYGRAFGGQAGQGATVACVQVGIGLLLAVIALLLTHRSGVDLDSGDSGQDRAPQRMWLPTLLLATLTGVFLVPLAWLARASIQPGRSAALYGGDHLLDPRSWEWSNFATVWGGGMSEALVTSLALAVVVVFGTLFLAAPAAFGLAHLLRSPLWRYAALLLLVMGLLQPPSVTILPLFSLLHTLNLLDSIWGVILPEVARLLPFAVLLVWGYLRRSPREMLEAASLDGATSFQQMTRVALPLARPALLIVATWTFISSWNEYLLPTVVSQDGSLQTVPTLLATYIGKYDTQYGLLAASALLATLPLLLLYLAVRYPATAALRRLEHVA